METLYLSHTHSINVIGVHRQINIQRKIKYYEHKKCHKQKTRIYRIFKHSDFNHRTFYLRSGWRDSSLSGLLTVKGTGMREQGSLKGEGTHRGNLCVHIFKPNLP